MLKCTVLIAGLALSGCTASQALGVVNDAGAAAKNYAQEHIQTRILYRANKRRAVMAQYDALMQAADMADRDGDMALASEHWTAAIALMDREMPDLTKLRAKIRDFFEEPSETP